MKVIMAAPYCYPFSAYGGAERYTHSLAKYLVKEGCDVTLVIAKVKNNSNNKIYTFDGIEYKFIALPIPLYHRYSWLFQYIFNVELARYLRNKEFDILHAYHVSSFTYLHYKNRKPVVIVPFGLADLCQAKSVLVDVIFKKFLLEIPLKYCAKNCENILALNEAQRQRYSDFFSIPINKTFSAPHGLDIDLINNIHNGKHITRNELGLEKSDLVLINVNRLDKHKGVSYLIEALKILNYKMDVRLIIVGTGCEEERIKEQIKELNLADKVVHFKNISDEKMYSLYKIADISVTPTLWEGLPFVVLEAMAMGKPIVASNIPGIPDVVKENGYLVPVADSKGIAKAILKIYDSGNIYSMGEKSKEIAKSYDWTITAKKVLAKYKEILS